MRNPKRAVSIFTAFKHGFLKHYNLYQTPEEPMSTTPAPTVQSKSFPADIATNIYDESVNVVKDVENAFTYSPQSSITAVQTEITKLQAYEKSLEDIVAKNVATIETLSATNIANGVVIQQVNTLIAQLDAVVHPVVNPVPAASVPVVEPAKAP